MKKLILLPITLIAFAFQTQQTITPIAIGTAMPKTDVKLYDVRTGNEMTLTDNKGEKGTLVMFSCNTCPFVIANESRISEVQKAAQRMKIGMVIINSNEAYRSEDDSRDAMKAYAESHKFTVPYLVDSNSELADAFGATRTPESFLFDKDGKLVYHGAIDDSPKDEKAVKSHYLMDAMTALVKGSDIATKTTVSSGCSIKRKQVQ